MLSVIVRVGTIFYNVFLYFCFIFSYKSAAEIYFSDKNHTESK